jgi:eukaryotic-like serine/threonine-protein kinase
MLERLRTGDEIDGFRIGEEIHIGGTASIFSVTAPAGADPGFPLIMKVPRGGDPAGIIGFEMESMILPALSGGHVPRFVAAGALTKTPYLVMEWVEGQSVALLVQQGRLPAEEVARIGAELADALHDLHQQDAVHLDIKPDNVILRAAGKNAGEVALIDFGFAHHAHYPDLLGEEKRFAAGSAPYVSPEQMMGTRSDPRSDIFAMGVLLYELATGELPFGIPTTLAGMRDRLWKAPVPPSALVPGLPPWLQEVILRCMEPKARARYQSAAHVAFDLRHPEQILLTPRALQTRAAGFVTQTRLWWRSMNERPVAAQASKRLLSTAPVIMVAVDTSHPEDERHPALQWVTRQLVSMNIDFRLICVSVIRAAALGDVAKDPEIAASLHLEHKARLRRWIEPLRLPAHRLSLHVIEDNDPAATILDFAHRNHVDLIVIGAPGPSEASLAWWRSVASSVTANAQCSVHVVRATKRPRPG